MANLAKALSSAAEANAETAARISRIARVGEEEIGGTAVELFARLIGRDRRVARLVNRMSKIHKLMLDGRNHTYTLRKVLRCWNDWLALRKQLMKKRTTEITELVNAVDRHLAARYAYAIDTISELPVKMPGRDLVEAAAKQQMKRLGAGLVKGASAAARKATPAIRAAFEKLLRYLPIDHPAWDDIAAMAANPPTANAIQGKVGEHVSVALPEIKAAFDQADKEALELARRLGRMKRGAKEGWRVRVIQRPTYSPTVLKPPGKGPSDFAKYGVGEIYDASVLLVRDASDEAMPLLLHQVKSGDVSEAVKQIAQDTHREVANFLQVVDEAGNVKTYRLTPLPEGFSPRRLLVAPTPPTARAVQSRLPGDVVIEYVKSPFSKKEMNLIAELLGKVAASL